MHDTAVGTANFTGCVPASTGEGSGSPVTEGALTRRRDKRTLGAPAVSLAQQFVS